MPTTEACARCAEPKASQTKSPSQSAASCFENSASLASSSRMKAHIFEQQHVRRFASALLFASASAPDAIGGELDRLAAAIRAGGRPPAARLYFGFDLALWAAQDARRAPAARRARSPGAASARFRGCACRRRRAPPSSGTLKSTRMKTRLPDISRSRIDSLFMVVPEANGPRGCAPLKLGRRKI